MFPEIFFPLQRINLALLVNTNLTRSRDLFYLFYFIAVFHALPFISEFDTFACLSENTKL